MQRPDQQTSHWDNSGWMQLGRHASLNHNIYIAANHTPCLGSITNINYNYNYNYDFLNIVNYNYKYNYNLRKISITIIITIICL